MKKVLVVLLFIALLSAPCFANGQGEKAEAKKVVYWSMWNEAEPQGQVMAAAAEAFEEETGIEVDVVFQGREIRKILAPALDAGEQIDLFDEDIDRVNRVWGKHLLPLEDYVNKVYPTTGGGTYEDAVNAALIMVARNVGNGTLSCAPYQPFAFVVMYNKDLFKKAGITETPKNWAEFTEVCRKLKAHDIIPITTDDAYMAAFFGYNMSRLAGVEKTLKMAETGDFSDPAVLEFGKIWEDFAKKGYISRRAASYIFPAAQLEEIAMGKTAMYLNGTWLPNEIKGSAPDLNWGCFAWPEMNPAAGCGPETNNYGGQCFGINKNSKVAKEAFDFVVFMTTGKWDGELARESIGVPMGKDSEWPKQTADAKVVIENTTAWMPWGVGMEATGELTGKIKDNFKKLIAGTIDAEGFYEGMNK